MNRVQDCARGEAGSEDGGGRELKVVGKYIGYRTGSLTNRKTDSHPAADFGRWACTGERK